MIFNEYKKNYISITKNPTFSTPTINFFHKVTSFEVTLLFLVKFRK